ncbi:MAG: C1 family peptidase [Chthonomonadales bacterium]
MRQRGLSPRSQGSRGTCSVFAVTAALEYAMAVAAEKCEALSVEYLNWAAHQAAGRSADGGFFHEICKGFQTYGVCPEVLMPYQPQYTRPEPSQSARDAAAGTRRLPLRIVWIKAWDVATGLTGQQLERICNVLASGKPVFCGLRWPKREQWNAKVLQMCAPSEVFDGHSVLLVGFVQDEALPGGGGFLIWNSGGTQREGILPFAFVEAYGNDAAYIRGSSRPKTQP